MHSLGDRSNPNKTTAQSEVPDQFVTPSHSATPVVERSRFALRCTAHTKQRGCLFSQGFGEYAAIEIERGETEQI